MQPYLAVVCSAPVAAAAAVVPLIYPSGQGNKSENSSHFQPHGRIPACNSFGIAGLFGFSLFSTMHGSLASSSLIGEPTENESG